MPLAFRALAPTSVYSARPFHHHNAARLAQSVERKALNLVVVGSSPTVGTYCSIVSAFGRINM